MKPTKFHEHLTGTIPLTSLAARRARYLMLSILLTLFAQDMTAQHIDRDKISADETLYELLSSNHTPQPATPRQFTTKDLEKTYDENLFLVKGTHYQLETINNSFYVKRDNDKYQPVFEENYPMESFVNIMLNQVTGQNKMLAITQHAYEGKKTISPVSLSSIHDMLGTTMDAYCSVMTIKKNKMKALLVFHHRKLDFIHMLILEATPDQLFSPQETIQANLYGNIPQSNLKNLFKKVK